MTSSQLTFPSIPKQYRALLDGDILIELFYNRGGFIEEIEFFLDSLAKLNNSRFYITDKALRRFEAEYVDQSNRVLLQIDVEDVYQSELKASEFKAVINYFHALFEENTVTVTNSIVQQARELSLPDFDSAIEHVCAQEHELDAIITQNPSNFPNTQLAIIPLEDIATSLSLANQMASSLRHCNTIIQEINASFNQQHPAEETAPDRNSIASHYEKLYRLLLDSRIDIVPWISKEVSNLLHSWSSTPPLASAMR